MTCGCNCVCISAGDCFELGKQVYFLDDHYHSTLWMEEALRKWDEEAVKTADRAAILDFMAYSYSQVGHQDTLHCSSWCCWNPMSTLVMQTIITLSCTDLVCMFQFGSIRKALNLTIEWLQLGQFILLFTMLEFFSRNKCVKWYKHFPTSLEFLIAMKFCSNTTYITEPSVNP